MSGQVRLPEVAIAQRRRRATADGSGARYRWPRGRSHARPTHTAPQREAAADRALDIRRSLLESPSATSGPVTKTLRRSPQWAVWRDVVSAWLLAVVVTLGTLAWPTPLSRDSEQALASGLSARADHFLSKPADASRAASCSEKDFANERC